MPACTFLVRHVVRPAAGKTAEPSRVPLFAGLARRFGGFWAIGIMLAKSLPVLVKLLHNKNWLVSSLPSPRIPSRGVFFRFGGVSHSRLDSC
jgi:hypothetical protein